MKVLLAILALIAAPAIGRASTVADGLLLSKAQWADACVILRRMARSANPDAVIFMGSRAHKLWRGGFDLDFSLIGERYAAAKTRMQVHHEFCEDGLAFRGDHGFRLDHLDAFGAVSLKRLLDDELLLSEDESARVLTVGIEICNRCAWYSRWSSSEGARALDPPSRIKEVKRLGDWRFEPARELPNFERAQRFWEKEAFLGTKAWSPLVESYEVRAVFFGVFAGVRTREGSDGRVFHTHQSPILVHPRAKKLLERLRARGYSASESSEIFD